MAISWPSVLRQTWRNLPPTRRSFSLTVMDQPGGPRSQRLRISGWDIASQTRWRGASNTRVITISRSAGVVTLSNCCIAKLLLALSALGFGFTGLEFFKDGVEALEVLF